MNKNPKRCEISDEYKWKLEDMYSSDDMWEKDALRMPEMISQLADMKDEFTKTAKAFAQYILFDEKVNQVLEKLYVYANQRSHEDMSVAKYQDMASRAESLMVNKNAQTSFAMPAIMKMSQETVMNFICQEKEIQHYGHYFEDLFREKEHVLKPELEQLLADAGEVINSPKDIFMMYNNADLKFPVIKDEHGEDMELTQGRYISCLESSNRRVREDAFKAVLSTYGKNENMLAAVFRANIKKHVFLAKERKFNSSLAYSLSGANIPIEVYHQLIEAVHDQIHLLHRYVKLRSKILGLDDLQMFDLYTPMVKEVERTYTYDEAKAVVCEGLTPLGEAYIKRLNNGLEGGWIDVYENEGKRSGAYSWGAYGTHPYVLLNYQGNLNSVFTLAHEMGHALHSSYSAEHMPYAYADYQIFVAEVASTCNESLLIQHLLSQAKTKEEKLYLTNYFLEQFRGTFFRQTMFAEFEMIMHQKCEAGETLTSEVIKTVYEQLNHFYYGDDIIINKEIAWEWARIPHFYSPFYVYQYATGFAAAVSISSSINEENHQVREGYLKFLSSGSSLYPIELLKLAGVDMTSKEPIKNAMRVFEQLLNEMEAAYE